MYVIFLFPMALAAVGVLFTFAFTKESSLYKAILLGLLILSLCFQFVPQMRLHFLIPLFIQVGLSLWFIFYWKTRF